jgi:glycosyltransferase 2 family protein
MADTVVAAAAGSPAVAVSERDHPVAQWAPVDIARVVAGLAVAAAGLVLAAVASETLGGMQADLARAVGRLPGPARTAAIGLAQIAAVVAPVVVLAAALASRRPLMVVALVGGEAAAAAVMSLLGHTIIDDAHPAAWEALVERESWITGRAFPTSAYIAGAVAAVVVTVRWLGPRWARPLWSLVVGFAVVRVVSGTNLPLDLVVAFGVGLAAGSAALLVVGSPDLAPRADAVVAALRRAGLDVVTLDEQDAHRGVTRSYRARTPGGELVVDVRSESDRDRDLAARAYGRLRTRTPAPGEVFASVERASERAAFVGLWLERLGLPVARPAAVARVEPGGALVARTALPGRTLAHAGRDEALAAAWRAVAVLHRNRVAHGALDADAVVVDDDDRAWLQRLHTAELDAPEPLLMIDRANLLVATALTVGPPRAVAACRAGLGDDGLAATLPYLQIPALPLATRLRLRGREKEVTALREHARTAVGADEVELVRLARVQASTLIKLAAGVLALVILLPQLTTLSEAARAMGDAHWPWLLPVVPGIALGYVATTVTFRAATPVRPPFGLTYLTQIAAATLNRVTPNGIGGLGTNIRFLQRSGYDTTEAATVMAVVSLAGGIDGAVLIGVFLVWAGQTSATFPWPSGSALLVAFGVVLGVVGLVLAIPALRRFLGDRLVPILHKARDSVADLLADPRRCATVLAGSLVNSLLLLLCLWFVLRAFGASISVAVMGAVFFGGRALAGAAPTPGGVGAVEATLIGGLSAAGVDAAVATPAVLVFRLLTHWAVVIPGWWALRVLRAREVL